MISLFKKKMSKPPFKHYIQFGDLAIEQMKRPRCARYRNGRWYISRAKRSGGKK